MTSLHAFCRESFGSCSKRGCNISQFCIGHCFVDIALTVRVPHENCPGENWHRAMLPPGDCGNSASRGNAETPSSQAFSSLLLFLFLPSGTKVQNFLYTYRCPRKQSRVGVPQVNPQADFSPKRRRRSKVHVFARLMKPKSGRAVLSRAAALKYSRRFREAGFR